MGAVTNHLPSSAYPHCADPLLAPYNWCSEQWTYLGSTIEAEQSCLGEVIKRIALFVPLALASFVAVLGFALHAAITACYPLEFPPNPELTSSEPILPAPPPPLPERVSQAATVVLPPQASVPPSIQTVPVSKPATTETFFGVNVIYKNGKLPNSPTISLTADRRLLVNGDPVLIDSLLQQIGLLKISPSTTSITVYDKSSLPFTHPYVRDNRCVIRQTPAPDQSQETEWNVGSFEYICISLYHSPEPSIPIILSATPLASHPLDPQDIRAKGIRLMQKMPDLRFDSLAYSPMAKIAIASATDLSTRERFLYLTSAKHAEFVRIHAPSHNQSTDSTLTAGPFLYTVANDFYRLCSLLVMPPLWEENFSGMSTDHIQECRDVQYIGLRGMVRELNGESALQPKTLQLPGSQITIIDETNGYVRLIHANGVDKFQVNRKKLLFFNLSVKINQFLGIQRESPQTLRFRPLATPGMIELRITHTVSDGTSSSKSVYFDLLNRYEHDMAPSTGLPLAYSYPPHPLTAEQARTKCIPFLTGTPYFSIKQAVFSPRTGLIALIGNEDPTTTNQTVYYLHSGLSEFQRFQTEYEETMEGLRNLTDNRSAIALSTNWPGAASGVSLDGMPGIALDMQAVQTELRTHLDAPLKALFPSELRSLVASYAMQTPPVHHTTPKK